MDYRMKGGATLTDEDFERMAEDAEKGNYPGEPGEWIVRPQGRPRLSNEELVTIAFKVPASERDALDRKAAEHSQTRSQYLRALLSTALSG